MPELRSVPKSVSSIRPEKLSFGTDRDRKTELQMNLSEYLKLLIIWALESKDIIILDQLLHTAKSMTTDNSSMLEKLILFQPFLDTVFIT